MAIGGNKRVKKGKKKAVDVWLKKDWYTVRAPSIFQNREPCQTVCTRTSGTKIASENLKGRVFEVSLADLTKNEDNGHRKIKLRVEDVQGNKLLTNFYGMELTRDRQCSLVKKWQTLIEARADVKTTDGYTLRLFCIAFTERRPQQMSKTWYAQTGQIKQIRKKMVDTMTNESVKCDLKELVVKFIPEVIGKEITKSCSSIFPLQNVHIRKVKVLKAPKFDLVRLMDLHGDDGAEDVGAKVDRIDPAVEEQVVAGSGGRY